MRTGKLPPELLAKLLDRIPRTDPRVLLGSGVGEDAAVIDFSAPPAFPLSASERRVEGRSAAGWPLGRGEVHGNDDRLLIAKTDPITFASDLIGWYAVHVNANDVACAGAVPRWFLASALLPERWDEAQVASLFDQLVGACSDLGVSLVGGHTEVTGGIDRPIVVGCMLGEVERVRMVRTGGGQPGDDVILTQGIAVEGTAVLAREAADQLRERGMPAELIERAQGLLFTPGISVVAAAQALCAAVPPPDGLHSLHDPTEGGLSSGLWEVAEASGVGAVVEAGAVETLPETRAVCEALGLDPLGLLASGALLAAVAPAATSVALDALQRQGIPARVIGRLTCRDQGTKLLGVDGRYQDWPRFDRDEVARYFEEAAPSSPDQRPPRRS
ncbi:MAG: AIR synthase-related protein [Chloroflexota bacterium]